MGCVYVFLRGVVKPSLCVCKVRGVCVFLRGVAKLCMCVHTPQRCCKARCAYACAPMCEGALLARPEIWGVCVCPGIRPHRTGEPAPPLEQAPGRMELPQWAHMVPASANGGRIHLNVTRNHLKSHYFELIYLNFYRNLIRVKYVIISPVTILQKRTYNARTP